MPEPRPPFEPSPSDYHGPERRATPRYSPTDASHLTVKVADYDGEVVLQDISAGSISFQLDRRHKPGSFLYVELINTLRNVSQKCTLRVVRLTSLSNTRHLVAGAFVYRLTDEEFKALIT